MLLIFRLIQHKLYLQQKFTGSIELLVEVLNSENYKRSIIYKNSLFSFAKQKKINQ